MEKLRIGILLSDADVPAWWITSLKQTEEYCEISALIFNGSQFLPHSRGNLFFVLLWKIINIVDRLLTRFFYHGKDAFANVSIEKSFPAAKIVRTLPRMTKFSVYYENDDLQKIKDCSCDMFVRIGAGIIQGEILTIAPYGIWSFHHGNNRVIRGGPAAFWEFIGKMPQAGATLQILGPELDGGLVIERIAVPVADAPSYGCLKQELYQTALTLLPVGIKRLCQNPQHFLDSLRNRPENIVPVYDRRLFTPRSHVFSAFLKYFIRIFSIIANKLTAFFLRKVIYRFSSKNYHDWGILYQKRRGECFHVEIYKFKKIFSPKNEFWADPFIWNHNNCDYIFFERYDYKKKKGKISVITEKGNNEWNLPVDVIDEPFHLSYPFLFEENGVLYMLPEARESRQVTLYRCVGFPDQWTKEKILLDDISGVDPSLLKWNGKYYLFLYCKTYSDAHYADQLCIFYADQLTGKYLPHKGNPVSMDLSSARPGGNFFQWGEHLFRVGQNGRYYGYGLSILEILELTETSYLEKEVDKIEPCWESGIQCIHTLNFGRRFIVADFKRR